MLNFVASSSAESNGNFACPVLCVMTLRSPFWGTLGARDDAGLASMMALAAARHGDAVTGECAWSLLAL